MRADTATAQGTAPGWERLRPETADGDLLGRRISAWLAMHRVHASDLAQAAGTSKSGLPRALHGKLPFPVSLALRMCHYTGMNINGDTVTFDPRRARQGRPALPDLPKSGE
jgi:hypothetical protein